MKSTPYIALLVSTFLMTACATADRHDTSIKPQQVMEAVNAKYPAENINLIYIGAPEGNIAPGLAVKEVVQGVDAGKVTAIESALAIKTSTVLIVGADDELNAATLTKVFTNKKEISGAKIIYVGGNENHANLSKLAADAGVNIEFMELPS